MDKEPDLINRIADILEEVDSGEMGSGRQYYLDKADEIIRIVCHDITENLKRCWKFG